MLLNDTEYRNRMFDRPVFGEDLVSIDAEVAEPYYPRTEMMGLRMGAAMIGMVEWTKSIVAVENLCREHAARRIPQCH